MRYIVFPFFLICLSLFSCTGQAQQKVETKVEPVKQRSFVLSEIPLMLDTPAARATFLAQHYWDHFDFADTAYIHLPDITEQAIVNFMDLMQHVSEKDAETAIGVLYEKAAPHSSMLWHFWETMSRYWKDANSPIRNEELFIKMCRQIESVPQVEEVLKQRAAYSRQLVEKNRVGQPATDFVYTLESGNQGRLYGLKAAYTLVFFYNPDCHTCGEIKEVMKKSLLLKDLVSKGQLKILTLYPDEDVQLWKSHLHEMSNEWINAYDKGQVLTLEHLYDLSAIPSFYLLDKDKKVLLKDVDWMDVQRFFAK